MARLESTRTNDRTPTLSAALYGRWRGHPPRRARALSGRHALPHPRHEPAVDHRDLRIFGLHPTHKRRHYGPLQASKGGTRVVVLPSGLPMTAAAPVGSRRGMSEVTPYGLPSASDMPRKRHKPEEITAKLQQVDVLVARGWSIADAARQVGITESRYYRWREERGALKRDELEKPKELAHEGPKGLAQGELSVVRDNAQRDFKAESAGFEE